MSKDDQVHISVIDSVTPEFVEALHRMISQLSPGIPLPSRDQLEAVIACPTNTLFVANVNNCTVGTLTLTMLLAPNGTTGWISDVIVDNRVRGKGIGERLVREAIDRAKSLGARYVDLSSRPVREAANRLYQRIGFEKRETNYYRYML